VGSLERRPPTFMGHFLMAHGFTLLRNGHLVCSLFWRDFIYGTQFVSVSVTLGRGESFSLFFLRIKDCLLSNYRSRQVQHEGVTCLTLRYGS
jgi:hypothetical protein